jgi:hypothetical protein
MPSIISTPTFTKSDLIGWDTRLIFSQNYPEQMDLNATNYFNAIPTNYVRGALGSYPINYWSDARVVRLKAGLMYDGSGSKLDIGVWLNDGSNTVKCNQNGGNSHDFAQGNTVTKVPINLEVTLVRGGVSDVSISGFYQYEWQSYASGGPNNRVVYVPMTYAFGNLDFTQPTQMIIYVGNEPITFLWMTMEELG